MCFLFRFWRCLCFFSTCRPLRKYAKTNTKQTFSHFVLFVFFDKKGQKTIQNFSAKKSLEKDHTWHPKSIQNPVISAFWGTKIGPERLKKIFFGVSFFACSFDVFFFVFFVN